VAAECAQSRASEGGGVTEVVALYRQNVRRFVCVSSTHRAVRRWGRLARMGIRLWFFRLTGGAVGCCLCAVVARRVCVRIWAVWRIFWTIS
jgi:hypothetical protein